MSSSKNLEYKKTSFLNKSNSAFIEQMYLKFINDDSDLPESWKNYFLDIGEEIDLVVKEITEQEMQNEIQKQLRMMPGQEKIVKEYYEKNPTALASLRGSLYEEKILQTIKTKAKANKKEVSKLQAESILKEENEKHLNEHHSHTSKDENVKKNQPIKKQSTSKKAKSSIKKTKIAKKVSKK